MESRSCHYKRSERCARTHPGAFFRSLCYTMYMAKKPLSLKNLDHNNAVVLAQLVVEPTTPDSLRVQILNRLAEGLESDNFFDTVYAEDLDVGECPECGHTNHWLIPEDDLNKKGWVTHEEDTRVVPNTTKVSCPKWQQACKKKKVII